VSDHSPKNRKNRCQLSLLASHMTYAPYSLFRLPVPTSRKPHLYWLLGMSVPKIGRKNSLLHCSYLQLTASLCVHLQLTATLRVQIVKKTLPLILWSWACGKLFTEFLCVQRTAKKWE